MYRILIASHDGVLRKTLAFMLNDLEAKFEFALTEQEVLDHCRKGGFGLVLLVGAVAPAFRQGFMETLRAADSSLPRVFVISWQQSERLVGRMRDVGVDQYMTLPVSLHRLRAKIQQEISLWRM